VDVDVVVEVNMDLVFVLVLVLVLVRVRCRQVVAVKAAVIPRVMPLTTRREFRSPSERHRDRNLAGRNVLSRRVLNGAMKGGEWLRTGLARPASHAGCSRCWTDV
jgi:hypothetical protein